MDRTGRACRRIVVESGGTVTIRVTIQIRLFAFKSCAIRRTTHIVNRFYAPARRRCCVKAMARGPQHTNILDQPSVAVGIVVSSCSWGRRREAVPCAGTGRPPDLVVLFHVGRCLTHVIDLISNRT